MNEKNKSIVALIVVVLIIAFFTLVQAISSDSNQTTSYSGKVNTDYEAAFASPERQVLMLGRDGCGWCQKFRPHLNYLSSTYDFVYYYADTDELTSAQLQALLERLGVDVSEFGTPYVAILENGEKVAEIGGYVEEASLFQTLQANGIIDSDVAYVASETDNEESTSTTEEDNSAYTSLSFSDYATYKQAYDSGERMVIVLGQTGCGHCSTYKPIINEIAEENQIVIHYLNVKEYTNEEVQNLLTSLSSYFDGVDSWGTPLTLIVENGQVIASQKGSASKEDTVKFLQDNGVIPQ